jgi:hypothetical protein
MSRENNRGNKAQLYLYERFAALENNRIQMVKISALIKKRGTLFHGGITQGEEWQSISRFSRAS